MIHRRFDFVLNQSGWVAGAEPRVNRLEIDTALEQALREKNSLAIVQCPSAIVHCSRGFCLSEWCSQALSLS
jgi:hypothetical protein